MPRTTRTTYSLAGNFSDIELLAPFGLCNLVLCVRQGPRPHFLSRYRDITYGPTDEVWNAHIIGRNTFKL